MLLSAGLPGSGPGKSLRALGLRLGRPKRRSGTQTLQAGTIPLQFPALPRKKQDTVKWGGGTQGNGEKGAVAEMRFS